MSPRSVLVLFAHPALEHSRVQRRLLEAPSGLAGVRVRDLYELYPDLDVDVGVEQSILGEHDAVLFQHPFYWYSAPPLVKQWQDLVLEHGWAYGHEGRALSGKLTFHVLSAGGGEEAYGPEGYNRFSVPELLRPFEQTAALCRMRWLPPYVVHGTHRLADDVLDRHVENYRRLLIAVRDRTLDEARAARSGGLQLDLDALIGEEAI